MLSWCRKFSLTSGIVLFLACLTLPLTAEAGISQLSGFRVSSDQHSGLTRLVFEFNHPIHYRFFGLRNPHRLVVDLDKTAIETNLRKVSFKNTIIKDVRTAKKPHHNTRVVFDLKSEVMLKHFTLGPKGKYKERLVFDLYGSKTSTADKEAKPIYTARRNHSLRPVVVVIDPGHGGKDPGATGPGGIHEKNVVLSISKDLAADLKKQKGIKVYLTRRGDYYLTLRQRLRIARKDKADIFIAIHADAYKNAYSRGASVYALSLRGASSEAAHWLAAKENYSELGGVDLSDKNNMLRSVLINLSQTATIAASLQLGSDVLSQLGGFAQLHHKTVEQARFVVLKSPDIPSVLVETGFLSNPKEERLLRSGKYQHRIAAGIMKGVYQYFQQRPPRGTYIAAQVKNNERLMT